MFFCSNNKRMHCTTTTRVKPWNVLTTWHVFSVPSSRQKSHVQGGVIAQRGYSPFCSCCAISFLLSLATEQLCFVGMGILPMMRRPSSLDAIGQSVMRRPSCLDATVLLLLIAVFPSSPIVTSRCSIVAVHSLFSFLWPC